MMILDILEILAANNTTETNPWNFDLRNAMNLARKISILLSQNIT